MEDEITGKKSFIDIIKQMLVKFGIDTDISNAKTITFQEKFIDGITTIDLQNQTFQRAGQKSHNLDEDDEHIQCISGITSVKIDNKEIVKQSISQPLSNSKSKEEQYTKTLDQVKITQPSIVENTTLYQINDDTKSAIRIKLDKTWEHEAIIGEMSNILAEAIRQTGKKMKSKDHKKAKKLLKDGYFLAHVIDFAQENGGVGNAGPAKWFQYLKEKNISAEGEQDFNIAKELSHQYQISAKKHRFLTGRTEKLKDPLVGQRLSRIPEDYENTIVENALAKIQELKR